MSILLDTDVLIHVEKGRLPHDWDTYASHYGEMFISAITVSELLVGVFRADTPARQAKRSAFIESVLGAMVTLDFTLETARIHARLLADLASRGEKIGANDLMIAATALFYGYPVLTSNTRGFSRIIGLDVLTFNL